MALRSRRGWTELKRTEARYEVAGADGDETALAGREELKPGLQSALKAHVVGEAFLEEQRGAASASRGLRFCEYRPVGARAVCRL